MTLSLPKRARYIENSSSLRRRITLSVPASLSLTGATCSNAARELLRRRLAGDDRVTPENLEAYRELSAARIMYPVSTWAGGPESVFRFTPEGWERREEVNDERAVVLHP